MTDEELIARLRDAPADGLGTENLCLAAADRIEALTEQLAAAQQDAKEAEAYAEELERELNTCRMAQAVMDNTAAGLKDGLTLMMTERDEAWKRAAHAEKMWGEAEVKLAKAMETVAFASNMDPIDWSEVLDVKNQARATIAEIKGESHE